jgi:hypothetical protein
MTTFTVGYQESRAEHRTPQVPLSHVSIELGHLYAEDFERGPRYLAEHFRQVKPWMNAVIAHHEARTGRPPRVSTCYLVDDYFTPFGDPPKVFATLQEAAEESGIQIDYIARESGCAVADGVEAASLMLDKLTPEPVPNTTGARPPVSDIGWLANGERSGGSNQAMSFTPWTPPRENAPNRHSIFVDVELWDDRGPQRRWACAYLAAVWQLARLGLLRDARGEAVLQAYKVDEIPDAWDKLPAVVQVDPTAKPFSAYRVFSILNSRYLPVELATRVILSQVSIDESVVLQIIERAHREKIMVDKATVDRIEYAFVS